MRTFVSFILVAISATAVLAAPAQNPVDWAAAQNQVNEIVAVVQAAGEKIAASAEAGTKDPAVSNSIKDKLVVAKEQARLILVKVNAAVEAQTLTVADVKASSGNLKSVIGQFLGNISAELPLLNPIHAAQIRAAKEECFDGINLREKELIIILTVPAGQILAIDWNAVDEKINQIRTALKTANDNIVNSLEGRQESEVQTILDRLQDARTNAAPVLNRLSSGARDQTLTKAQAGEELGALERELGNLKNLIGEALSTLPPLVANEVRGNITGAQIAVGAHGGELKNLLSA